jgi:prepilin-type N-terminal cleavage/methylation domain-containing protein
MRHNGFTLIELVISIALFGLITIFLFGAINQLRKEQTFFQQKELILSHKNQILFLLRTDFDRAQALTLSTSSNKNFDTITIVGSNHSLYGIDHPYIMWLVLKADNSLVRLESSSLITMPIIPEKFYLTHSDLIGKQCELFRLYDSVKHRLIYLKFENGSPLIVETTK